MPAKKQSPFLISIASLPDDGKKSRRLAGDDEDYIRRETVI